jgi:tetratricopeptide (TPR) repeat protein
MASQADRYRGRRSHPLNGPNGLEPTGFEEWWMRARESDRRGDTGAAITQYEQALSLLRADEEDHRAADVLRHLGSVYRGRGEVQRAERRYEQSFEMASRIGYINGMADAANWLGVIAMGRGDFDAAERFFADARRHALSNNHFRLVGAIDLNLGILANIRGDLNAAMAHYRSAQNQFYDRADHENLGLVMNNIGLLCADLDRFDEAARAFDEAFALARETHNLLLENAIEANRAELFIATRRFPEAASASARAKTIAQLRNDRQREAEALKFQGVIAREEDALDTAANLLTEAESLATQCEDRLLAAESARELGEVYARKQAWADARSALTRALQSFLVVGARIDWADVERRLAKLPSPRPASPAPAVA